MGHESPDRPNIAAKEKSSFLRCKGCRRIYRREEIRDLCPGCGTQRGTEAWPGSLGRRLFNAAERFLKRGDRELTVIVTCDFLEMLMERFFMDLFVKQGKPPSWIRLTFRKNKSLDLRLRYLFKETVQVSFSSALKGSAFEGFDRRWALIRSVKSTMYHTSPSAVDETTAREAYSLLKSSLDFFAWLNNRYCV